MAGNVYDGQRFVRWDTLAGANFATSSGMERVNVIKIVIENFSGVAQTVTLQRDGVTFIDVEIPNNSVIGWDYHGSNGQVMKNLAASVLDTGAVVTVEYC